MVYAFPSVFSVLACLACAHVCACVQYWSARLRPVCMCPCVCVRVYVFQESQWLDSVSLLIKDTLEGEMLMIDNLSGSVFHHYSSPPPVCRDCKGHPQEVPPHVDAHIHALTHTHAHTNSHEEWRSAITPHIKFILVV